MPSISSAIKRFLETPKMIVLLSQVTMSQDGPTTHKPVKYLSINDILFTIKIAV